MLGSKIAGVDIGTSGIKIAVGSPNKRGVKISALHFVPLPTGVVSNDIVTESGAATLRRELKLFWDQNKVPKNVVLGFAGMQAVRTTVVTLPDRSRELLRPSLGGYIDAKNLINQVTSSALAYDYVPLSRMPDLDPETGERQMRAFLIGIIQEHIKPMVESVTLSGLNILNGDLSLSAASKTIPLPPVRKPSGIDVLIDFGAESTKVLFHQSGLPYDIAYTQSGSGNSVTKSLTRHPELGGNWDEAEKLKLQPSASRPDWVNNMLESVPSKIVRTVPVGNIKGLIEDFLDDPSNSFDHVSNIEVIGGAGNLAGLRSEIGEAFNTTVQRPQPPSERITLPEGLMLNGEHDFHTAVGLLLGAK